MLASSSERPQDVEQGALEKAADPAELEQRCGEQHDGRLDDDVAIADVGELVRQHALDLGGRQGEQAHRERDRRRPHATAGGEAERRASVDHIQPRLDHLSARRESRDNCVEVGVFAFGQLARAEHAHDRPIGGPVQC